MPSYWARGDVLSHGLNESHLSETALYEDIEDPLLGILDRARRIASCTSDIDLPSHRPA